MKKFSKAALIETIASPAELRDRFLAADAGAAARQIEQTPRDGEAELASRSETAS